MSFTDYMENALLDHIFAGQSTPAVGTLYLALSSTTPNDDGTNFTEPVEASYARAAVLANNTNFPAASAGSIKNGGVAISFPKALEAWTGPLTHFGIFDASSGGNLLAYGALTSSQSIVVGNVFTIPVDELVINLT